VAALVEDHERKLQELRDNYESQIEQLKQSHSARTKELTSEMENAVDALKKSHKSVL
jgi:sugar-specific transcriptional regulator TrmB